MAMHQAIYSTTARSRYALIIEDDVKLPFHIDFEGAFLQGLILLLQSTAEETLNSLLTI